MAEALQEWEAGRREVPLSGLIAAKRDKGHDKSNGKGLNRKFPRLHVLWFLVKIEGKEGLLERFSNGDSAMKIVCTFCGQPFTILPQQLGTSRPCPHCASNVQLPRASNAPGKESEEPLVHRHPLAWLDGWISGLLSLVFHMTVMILIALFQDNSIAGGDGGFGPAEKVGIGIMPDNDLTERPESEISVSDAAADALRKSAKHWRYHNRLLPLEATRGVGCLKSGLERRWPQQVMPVGLK